jgi:hypothetical protein
MKKLAFIFYVLIFFSSIGVVEAEAPAGSSLNQIMTDVGKITVDIYPLIMAQRAYSKKEVDRIQDALTKLTKLFSESAPFMSEKSDGYQVSYEFISHYLDIVNITIQTRHIDYVRTQLYALGEICASCHTQDTVLRTLFSGTRREALPSDYAFAELNFMTREYDEAIKYYEKFLNSPGRKTELNVIQPLQRIITIYTQVYNNPAEAIRVLEKYTNYDRHTPETLAELKNWISGLKVLEASKVEKSPPQTFADLQRYVGDYLGRYINTANDVASRKQSNAKQEVQRVWLRGQLYHYLNKRPKENEIPMLLYWLAVIDRSIAYNFYFSLADLYLKQCVLKYPRHAYAQRCFDEYEHYVEYNYVQNGEKIPPGIQQELIQMRMALRANQVKSDGVGP